MPHFHQGTDLCDFSLADPDNRRPVDFEKRTNMLAELKRKATEMTGVKLAWELSLNKDDGRIMLYLAYKALNFRKANRDLFMNGEYAPLETTGAKAGHAALSHGCPEAPRQSLSPRVS